MKTNQNYLYFGRYSTHDFTATAGGATYQLTTAMFGDVTQLAENGSNIQVVIRSHDGGGTRGASSGAADYYSGVTFPSATDTATDEYTLLPDAAVAVHATNGTITIAAHDAAGNTGYTLDDDDTVRVILEYTGVEMDSICYPMANYLGADPVSEFTTNLFFKSVLGDADSDAILLTHATGKYKDICQAMHKLSTATPQSKMITFADPHNNVYFDADLGITEVHINQDLS